MAIRFALTTQKVFLYYLVFIFFFLFCFSSFIFFTTILRLSTFVAQIFDFPIELFRDKTL